MFNGDTLSNVNYMEVRDKFSNYQRLQRRKDIETITKNEKMFNRLLSILKNENSQIYRHRNLEIKGPVSMNIGQRRKTVAEINRGNSEVSRKLETVKSCVPTISQLKKHEAKTRDLHILASTSRFNNRKDDPLIKASKNFVTATASHM